MNLEPWPKKPTNKQIPVNKTPQTDCKTGEKRCSACKTIKTHEEYWKRKDTWDGYQPACIACQKASRPNRIPRHKKEEYTRRRAERGYTIIEGHGMLINGSHIDWRDLHIQKRRNPDNYGNHLSFMDGTIIKHNKTGKLFEIWNKPFAYEVKDHDSA